MSRVWAVNHCQDCPANQPNWSDEDVWCDWCNKAKRKIVPSDATGPFPAWCPLPESGEKEGSNAKG